MTRLPVRKMYILEREWEIKQGGKKNNEKMIQKDKTKEKREHER